MLHKVLTIILTIIILASCNNQDHPTTSAASLDQQIADHVFLNAYVYTVDADRTIAQAIATKSSSLMKMNQPKSILVKTQPSITWMDKC